CRKAMAPLPDSRYASMREFVTDLVASGQSMKRPSEPDLRLPLSGSKLVQPVPASLDTSGLRQTTSGASSPTFSQLQQVRHPSETTGPGTRVRTATGRLQPNLLPWLVATIVAGVALASTLFLLKKFVTSSRNPTNSAAASKTGSPSGSLEKLL